MVFHYSNAELLIAHWCTPSCTDWLNIYTVRFALVSYQWFCILLLQNSKLQNVFDLTCLHSEDAANWYHWFFPRIENVFKYGISKENNNIANTQNKKSLFMVGNCFLSSFVFKTVFGVLLPSSNFLSTKTKLRIRKRYTSSNVRMWWYFPLVVRGTQHKISL